MSVALSRQAQLVALALAAHATAGCAFPMTHRCAVPQPVVEAMPGGGKLPLAVAVRTAGRTTPSETFEQRDEYHRWGVDPLPPSRVMFDRLAGSMFERRVADAGAPAPDAVLEVRVEEVRFAWASIGFAPYAATVAYRVTLRAPDGAVVSEFDLAGEGSRGVVWEPATHCKGIGDAVALAMQDAGGKLVTRLGTDRAIATWLGARGVAAPVLAIRPAAAYPEPAPAAPPSEGAAPAYEPYAPPGMALPSVAASSPPGSAPERPVTAPAGRPQAPRSMQLRVGVGAFWGDSSPGLLENPRAGFTFTLLGMEVRPRPEIGVTMELGTFGHGYSARTLTSTSPFAVPTGIFLETTTFGVGVRGILPGGPVEPWIGATALLARTELSTSYSLFGLSGTGDPQSTAWSAGLDLGGGLLVYPGKRVQLGIEVRRLLSRASFDALPRDVSIGGWATTITFGGVTP